MTAATLSRLERDIAALASRVQSPAATLSPLEVAHRGGIDPDPWQRDVLTPTLSKSSCSARGKAGRAR